LTLRFEISQWKSDRYINRFNTVQSMGLIKGENVKKKKVKAKKLRSQEQNEINEYNRVL
jgi:hypothetical protein